MEVVSFELLVALKDNVVLNRRVNEGSEETHVMCIENRKMVVLSKHKV